jgi:hypothetical protein
MLGFAGGRSRVYAPTQKNCFRSPDFAAQSAPAPRPWLARPLEHIADFGQQLYISLAAKRRRGKPAEIPGQE